MIMGEYQYTMADVISETGLEAGVIRAKFRSKGVEKNDGKYQWAKKSELNDILKLFQEKAPAKGKKASKGDDAAEAKPAKGKKAKAKKEETAAEKPAKKGKKKKAE